ncbi:C39 family peptidase [Patescibacteria group bacterium]
MNKKRIIIIIFIVLISLAAGIYSQRVTVLDYWESINQPQLPPAVSHQQIEELPKAVNQPEPDFIEQPIIEPLADDQASLDQVQEFPSPNIGQVIEDDDEESGVRGQKSMADPDSLDQNLPPPLLGKEGGHSESPTPPTPPSTFNLAVPFTSQAPNANWELPYQEACEEASVYMVHSFYEGMKAGKIPVEVADAALLKIVEFEKMLFGDYLDTTAEQTALFAEQIFGYTNTKLLYNPTVDEIKAHVSAGRPVIVPAAGQQLGNPNFTAPGPLYHMLVIRGYTETSFITNDPGTRKGEAYIYKFDTIMQAMHDWNGGDVVNGQKVVIVIYPEG